jgi:hypothetical protein
MTAEGSEVGATSGKGSDATGSPSVGREGSSARADPDAPAAIPNA